MYTTFYCKIDKSNNNNNNKIQLFECSSTATPYYRQTPINQSNSVLYLLMLDWKGF
jgi:hypothetical protein